MVTHYFIGFHSRASFCASASWAGVIHLTSPEPSFHAVPFYPGQVVSDGAGANVWRKLYIDTTKLTNGVHKLFLRTDAPISSGTGSGVFVVEFVVDNPVATP